MALVVNWIDGSVIKLPMILRADLILLCKLFNFWAILDGWIIKMLLSLTSHLRKIPIRGHLTCLYLFLNPFINMICKPRAWHRDRLLLLLTMILLFVHLCGRCSSLKRHHILIIVGILI